MHTDRQAGIVGLFSPCHMPINELFRGVGVRVPSQSEQQIQNPFFLPSSQIQAQTPGSRLKSSWQQEVVEQTHNQQKGRSNA